MADGKHCPACGRDIGIWPVFSAGLPNRIWCPHCRARLTYRGARGLVLVLAVAVVAVAGVGYYTSAAFLDAHPVTGFALLGGILLAVWALIELAAVQYLRVKCQLARADGSGAERTDQPRPIPRRVGTPAPTQDEDDGSGPACEAVGRGRL
jgi:hypothetical protein